MPTRRSGNSIIIIGAGLAGLSAGCYAQMNGYRTRIFEMHNIPGGLCTSWKRKGYTIDGCIHWLTGSRFGLFHRLFQEVGAVQGREMHDYEEFVHVEGVGGKTLVAYTELDRLEAHLKELSPSDARTIEEVCKAGRVLARNDLPMEKPMELMGPLDMLKMLKSVPLLRVMRKYGQVTVEEFASQFKDPFLREAFPLILEVDPLFPMSALLLALGFLHGRNGGLPIGGSLEFAKAIEQRCLGLGGEIQYSSRVEKVLVEADPSGQGDRAVGVRLADGSEHRADIVISAADGRTTIFDMLGGTHVNDKIRHYYDEWPIYKPFIQISLGVARDFSNEPPAVTFPLKEPIQVGDEARDRLHVRHFCYDPTMAPAGKSVVAVTFLNNNHAYWKKLYEDRERYAAEKRVLADAVIDRLEARFAGIKGQIEVVDVATPVTYERYTGNWQGSYMGWLDSPGTLGKTMSKTLPGLGGFYMAGQWVYMGGGVSGAVMSGRHLMQILCKKDKKRFVTSTP